MADTEANKRFVETYMEAFRTFDPDVYFPYLAEEPTYMAGMNIRTGRDAFRANTDAGRLLYPRPEEARNEVTKIPSKVATRTRRCARPPFMGADYGAAVDQEASPEDEPGRTVR